jgi:hypothetical protein
MAKVFATIDDELVNWIAQQKMFFVATAPLSDEGLINCSPKGGDSFRVLGGTEVAYQDFTGSGVETIATCARTAASSSCSVPSRARRKSCACTVGAPWSPQPTRAMRS